MRSLFIFLLLLLGPGLAAAQKGLNQTSKNPPVLYVDATHRLGTIDLEARKAFSARFRIVEIKRGAGYQPMRHKGRPYIFVDPRSIRLWRSPFIMTYAYIVTADGRAVASQVLRTTDRNRAKVIADSFLYDRYAPARLRGVPVASLEYGEINIRGPFKCDNSYRDGLGIMGYRDR